LHISHRVLHSFPTRRSSDLLRWNGIPPMVLDITKPVHPSGPVLSRTSPPFRALYPGVLPRDVASAAVLASVNDMSSGGDQSWQEDRKSTRLNSSHVSISYAV